MKYAYRVIKEFGGAGDAGLRLFKIGEVIELDRPARSLDCLELVEEVKPVFVVNPDETKPKKAK